MAYRTSSSVRRLNNNRASKKPGKEDLYAGIVNAIHSAWFWDLDRRTIAKAVREGMTSEVSRHYRGLKPRARRSVRRRSRR